MTAPDRNQDMREHEQWRDLIEATAPERIGEGAMQRVSAIRARRRWWRRFGAPTALASGVLALAGVAAATGILTVGGLVGTTSHDDTAALDLRALVDELGPSGGGGQLSRSGMLSLSGLDIAVALDRRRLCISAPGGRTSGLEKLRKPDSARPLPDLRDVPRAGDLQRRPMQAACVDLGRLDGELPVISGSDHRGSWIVALAPDQIASVQATTGDGRTIELESSRNLAVGRSRSRSPFTRVRWRAADGRSRESSVSSK